jgi:hypothetical protein
MLSYGSRMDDRAIMEEGMFREGDRIPIEGEVVVHE